MKKIKIGVLYGGKSAEHEVSINSARNIMNALDKKKYIITPILIPKNGKFDILSLQKQDIIFPVLHGTYGEDGTMQGLLKILDLPFVGVSVLGSALGMDKEIAKRLMNEKGILNAKFITIYGEDKISYEKASKILGKTIFVKPANAGSSVGVSKVTNKKDWENALREAFLYDTKILAEEAILGRELECAVLGNENPIASTVGEIVLTTDDFYSYDAKYISENKARVDIPAKNLNKKDIKRIQDIAKQVFKILACEGLARVDVFLTKEGKIYVNEINTMPGFTDISMYPKLFEYSGIQKSKLLDMLVEFAFARYSREKSLKTNFK